MSDGSEFSPWVVLGFRGGVQLGSINDPDISPVSSLFIAGESQMLGAAETDQADHRWWHIDWEPLLNGDTLASVAHVISPAQGLVVTEEEISAANTRISRVKINAAAAMVGTTYRVLSTIQSTTSAMTLRRSFELTVRNL